MIAKTVVIKIMNKHSNLTTKHLKRQVLGKNCATTGAEKFVSFLWTPYYYYYISLLVVIVVIVVNVLVLQEFLVTGKKQLNI